MTACHGHRKKASAAMDVAAFIRCHSSIVHRRHLVYIDSRRRYLHCGSEDHASHLKQRQISCRASVHGGCSGYQQCRDGTRQRGAASSLPTQSAACADRGAQGATGSSQPAASRKPLSASGAEPGRERTERSGTPSFAGARHVPAATCCRQSCPAQPPARSRLRLATKHDLSDIRAGRSQHPASWSAGLSTTVVCLHFFSSFDHIGSQPAHYNGEPEEQNLLRATISSFFLTRNHTP